MNTKAQLLDAPRGRKAGPSREGSPFPDIWEAASTPESTHLLQRVQSQLWGFTT